MSRPPLLERLKQSAVVQAVVVFLGASWVVLQVVDLLVERLGLPGWIFPVALILLAVGLVVVLATAWVQSKPATTAAEEAGEIPTDWEVAPAEALASLREGRLPHLTWARAILGGVVAISLLIGSAGAYVLLSGGGARSLVGPTELEADEAATGLAVLPFEVNDPAMEAWREGVVDLLSPGLDGVAGYRTIASRTVLAQWRRRVGEGEPDLETTLSVAGATGARYAIVGNVVSLGTDVRMSAEVFDLSDGSKVADGSAEGRADNVLELVDRLGLDVMRNLMAEVGGEGVDARLPGRITTSSLAATRAFLEGEAHYRVGRLEDALRAYEEAIAADSTFGLPVFRAALTLGWSRRESEEEQAMERRLERVLDRLPARDRTLATIKLQINGDSVRDARPVETLVARYPDDPEAWFMLGEVRLHEPGLAGGGHGPAREAFERATELAPDFVPYLYHTLEYAIGAGDAQRTEDLMVRLEDAAPGEPRLPAYRWAQRLLHGDLERARAEVAATDPRQLMRVSIGIPLEPRLVPRVARLLEVVPTAGEYALIDQVSAFEMAVGHQRAALALLDSIPRGNSARVTLARHHQDLVGTLPGFDADAEYTIESCAGAGSPVGCLEKVALHAVDAGRFDEARSYVQRADSLADAVSGTPRAVLWGRIARSTEGYLAWKSGDVDGALRALREARQADRFAVTARWYLAEVLAAAGRPAEAVDLFLSIDDSPTWSPFSRLRAAQVLESMGDRDDAAENYRSALSAWDDADEGFEPKARAEAGLARVGG